MAEDSFPCVVEFPRGSRGLRSDAPYPIHAGFVPATLRADGHALSALIHSGEDAATGAELMARAIGLLGDRLVCADARDPARSPADLPEALRREVERFFGASSWLGPDAALPVLYEARARWATASVRPAE